MSHKLNRLNDLVSERIATSLLHKPNFLSFYLHKIYPSKNERIPKHGTDTEGITKDQFEQFVVYFKERNFNFIDEQDILNPEFDKKGKNIFLTFDDGYFNNFMAIDVLKKHEAKATFFISTNHIKEEKCYWWDILFSKRKEQNCSQESIAKEIFEKYHMDWNDVENEYRKEFGENIFTSSDDLMRPMNLGELKEFASHKEVSIGNHTVNHQNLSNYNPSRIRNYILESEEFLFNELGVKSKAIAYPYGFHNEDTLTVCKELNYKLGFTINEGKNYWNNYSPLEIKRFALNGYNYVPDICKQAYVNFSLLGK